MNSWLNRRTSNRVCVGVCVRGSRSENGPGALVGSARKVGGRASVDCHSVPEGSAYIAARSPTPEAAVRHFLLVSRHWILSARTVGQIDDYKIPRVVGM